MQLDRLADDYRRAVVIPPAPPPAVIRRRGRARRTRRRALAGLGLVAVAVVGAVAVVDRTTGEPTQVVVAGSEEPAPAVEPSDQLADLDPAEVPQMSAPVAEALPRGWTIRMIDAAVFNRFDRPPMIAIYELETDTGERFSLSVSGGEASGAGERVPIRRGDRVVEATATSSPAAGTHGLLWTESPGAEDGTAVSLIGPVGSDLVPVAELLRFEERPMAGTAGPSTIELPADADVLLVGELDGREWRVLRTEQAEFVIEVDGVAVGAGSSRTTSTLNPDIEVGTYTVSYDGSQLNLIVVPERVSDVQLESRNGASVPLAVHSVPGSDQAIALAAVPAGKHAATFTVTDPTTGTDVRFGLPWAPPTGWASSWVGVSGPR